MLNISFETSSLTESEVKALRALLDTLDTGTSRPKVAYGYIDPEAHKLVRTDPEPSDPETVPLSAGKEAPAAEEAPAKPRRKRRTKAEMEAARAAAATEEASVEEASVEEASVEEAPVEEAAVEEAPEESTSEVEEAAPEEAPEEDAPEEATSDVEEAPEESEELSEAQREEQYAQIAKMVRAFSSDPEKRPKAIAILRRLGLQSASEIRHRADLFEKLIEKLSEVA